MVKQAVAHAGFMDASGFWIGYIEGLIKRVLVGLGREASVKREDIPHKITLEFLHVLSLALAVLEFVPRPEEIFKGDDIFISMNTLPASHTLKRTPPPSQFCQCLNA